MFYLKVDFVFSQAEVFLSWKSLLLNNFFKDLDSALFELKDLVEKVCSWRSKLIRHVSDESALFIKCLF